jgi:hypothetical protein
VVGKADSGIGVTGMSNSRDGVYGETSSFQTPFAGVHGKGIVGVFGEGSTGVLGKGIGGPAILGISSVTGVVGTTDFDGCNNNFCNTAGVAGLSSKNAIGVYGSSFTGTGVFGISNSGLAGKFMGDVDVTGTLSKSSGSFKIDHPLDPENKYLYHSFVESPDMKNIYDGVVVLNENGEAVVNMPEWFDALNMDFRYQLTAIGAPAPNLYIAEEVSQNRFKIAGGKSGMKISWQVTGIRQDAYAKAHRIPIEQEKPEKERGYYLHPDVFGQSEEKGIKSMLQSEQMRVTGEQK